MGYRQDTIVAIATPPGKGALGIIRISGPGSRDIAQSMLGHTPKPRYAHLCHIKDTQNQLLDQGIVIYYQGPASFTGEDMLEVCGHGGRVVQDMLLAYIESLGARRADPGEFTERAFLNDKIDLVQAEAIADLIDSVSTRAARSALQSLTGRFSDRLNMLVDKLVYIRTLVEGSLDFPDEDVDFPGQKNVRALISECLKEINQILDLSRQGTCLRDCVQVIIFGPPNVGKSTLMNLLCGEDASIIHERPGTTRDIVKERVMIGEQAVVLFDTAGIRFSDDEIETEGVKRAHKAAGKADIILVMFEDKQDYAELEKLLDTDNPLLKKIYLKNKIDISGEMPGKDLSKEISLINISAKTGLGIDILKQEIEKAAGMTDMDENVILARQRHIDALMETEKHLVAAERACMDQNDEIIAEELRLAQEFMGKVTGKYVADDLLGEIFSSFCIGK